VISGPFSDAGGREAIVAAARFGAGRMVAFGHDGHLASALRDASTTALLANAANWAANKPAPRSGVFCRKPGGSTFDGRC
jgi:type 1 glutamine amidotransferase